MHCDSPSSTPISLKEALQKCNKNKFYLSNDFKYHIVARLSGIDGTNRNCLLRISDHTATIHAVFTQPLDCNVIDGIILIQSFKLISYQRGSEIHYAMEVDSNHMKLIHSSSVLSRFINRQTRLLQQNKLSKLNKIASPMSSKSCNIKGLCSSKSTILTSKESIPIFFAEFVDVTVYCNTSNQVCYRNRVKVIFENNECVFWNIFLSVNSLYLVTNASVLNANNSSDQSELVLKFQCKVCNCNLAWC